MPHVSIKRLNSDERVALIVGNAIINAVKNPSRDPGRQQEIEIVIRLLEAILSREDLLGFTVTTGAVSEDVYEDFMGLPYGRPPVARSNDDSDDDIPF